MTDRKVYADIAAERLRAHAKHYMNGNSVESKSHDDPMWLPILTEEVGEVARALCDGSSLAHLREELVQVAAMASAWVEACDRGPAN